MRETAVQSFIREGIEPHVQKVCDKHLTITATAGFLLHNLFIFLSLKFVLHTDDARTHKYRVFRPYVISIHTHTQWREDKSINNTRLIRSRFS